jgi:hypothetical protein
MHCTVKPGMYCIAFSLSGLRLLRRWPNVEAGVFPSDGADCGAGLLWCQEKIPQDIGVELPAGNDTFDA